VQTATVVRIASQASGIKQRHVVDEVAIDVVVFDQDRLAAQLSKVLVYVLKLCGRPIEIDEAVRAIVFAQEP
jgi:hypothetical protein